MPTIPNLDVRPDGTFAIPAIGYRCSKSLAAGVQEILTVPVDDETGKKANYVLFSADGKTFYADYTTSGADVEAAVPGDVSDGTAADQSPTFRTLSGVTKISVIAPVDAVVLMNFFI